MRLGTLGPPHGWPELDLGDLVFGKYGIVENRVTGDFFALHRGALVDAIYLSAAAYYVDEHGQVVFLERPPAGSPQTREEYEQRQAERELRRATPTPHRKWAQR